MAAWRPSARIVPLLALAVAGLVQGAWAGDPSPGHGPVVSVAKGTLPSAGEFRLSAQRFGRHGLCLSLAVADASNGSCNEDVPGERALSAEAYVQCAGDTVVTGVIAPGVKAVRVKFADGSTVRATTYARVPQLQVRARYYLASAKGAVSVSRVRALDARGRTLARGTFDFDQRCGGGISDYGGEALITVPEPETAGRRCGSLVRPGRVTVSARSIRAWAVRCHRARRVARAYLTRRRVKRWKCDLTRAPSRLVCKRKRAAVSFAFVARYRP